MTRLGVLKGINKIIQPTDIVIIVGEDICKESEGLFDDALFLDNNTIDVFSIVLGISLGTSKRVVLITEDSYMLKYFNSIIQLSVSNNINLILFTLVSNFYIASVNQPTLFNSIRAMKGIFFNMGIVVHDYSQYLDGKSNVKKFKDIYLCTKGPVIGLINIDSNRLYNKDCNLQKNNFGRFINFINKEIENNKENKGEVVDLESIIK